MATAWPWPYVTTYSQLPKMPALTVPMNRAEAIRLRPRWALPRVNLSITLSALGGFEDARVEAERATKLDPRSAKAYHALGCALGNLGRLNPAAEAFRRAVELDPHNDVSRAYLDKVTRQLQTRQ